MHGWMGMIICCKLKYWDIPLNCECADCFLCSGKHFKISVGTIFKEFKSGLNECKTTILLGKNSVHFDKSLLDLHQWKMTYSETRV